MKNIKATNIIYPQDLTPPKGYLPDNSKDSIALKAKCLSFWNKLNFSNQQIHSEEHLYNAITYTLFFVRNTSGDKEGLDRIKKYITSILFSFGHHSPIIDQYIHHTVDILKNKKSNHDADFLTSVINYLEGPDDLMIKTFIQLAEAKQAFRNWLECLPQELISEEIQEHLSVIFFRGIVDSIEDHPSSGVRGLVLKTVDQFLDYLSEITKLILEKIWNSIAKGDINETIKEASIIDRNKTSTEINLAFKNYSDQEKNYLTIIHQWGNMVSEFIDREIERKKSMTTLEILEQKTISEKFHKPVQPHGPSFPELFRDLSYYDKFIDLLIRKKLIDENLVWIGNDKNKMVGIFWGLLQVKNLDKSIFIPRPPQPTPYARKIYEHFKINQRALCSERYLRDYQKHKKVTFPIKNQYAKELESALFPNNY